MPEARLSYRGPWWVPAGIGVVLVVVAVAVTLLLTRPDAVAEPVLTLVPAAVQGADPFTDPATVQPGERAAATIPPDKATAAASQRAALPSDRGSGLRVAVGTAPGLYGGSGNLHVCDPTALVAYLSAHPDKASAWASVLGIRPDGVAGYVAALTPAVLTSDTLVGNHGYRSGHATSLLSVLQAGTAVLVDGTGIPRVKCNCGNPLTEPEAIDLSRARTSGTPWPGYTPGSVILVRPGKPSGALPLTDLDGTAAATLLPDGSYTVTEQPGHELDQCGPEPGAGSFQGLQLRVASGVASATSLTGITFSGPVTKAAAGSDYDVAVTLAADKEPRDRVTVRARLARQGDTVVGLDGTADFAGVFSSVRTFACADYSFKVTLTTATPPSTPSVSVGDPLAGLPAGLRCADLHARGLSYRDAVRYWIVEGKPALMDADNNGIPCETVYPAADVTAFWASRPTGSTAGCDQPAVKAAVRTLSGHPDLVFNAIICDGDWALAQVTENNGGSFDEANYIVKRINGRWSKPRGNACTDPTVPQDIAIACTVS